MKGDHIRTLTSNSRGTAAMPQAALTVPEEVAALTVAALARFRKSGGCSPDAGFLKGTKTVKWDR